MNRILVTGGAGFLGSHLCRRLARENEVICLDNFFTGRRANVEDLIKRHDFEVIRHDVCDPIMLEVDQIYHMACPASPVHYQRNPVRTIQTCVAGTLNMLNLAREAKARILIASTSEVYGVAERHPQKEDYWGNVNPVGPRSCYDEGKRCAESLAIAYAKQHALDIRIARIFNTYGPFMAENDGRVISNFIVECLRRKSITVYGDGSQTRSFCFVDDLVEGLVRLMGSKETDPINLGNPEEQAILEVAEKVRELLKCDSRVEFLPLPADDPVRRKPDISRAKNLLNWKPRIPFEEGLQRTIEHFHCRPPRVAWPR